MPRIVEELENGVIVRQITDEPERLISNIYCERPYSSADGKRFLFRRSVAPGNGADEGVTFEYLLCEFDSWETQSVGIGDNNVPVSYNNDFYITNRGEDGIAFARVDLATGEAQHVFTVEGADTVVHHPTVSPDGRYIGYGVHLGYDPQCFGVEVVDTHTGERRVIHEDTYLCNTHLQWEPGEGRQLLVQHNRGCEYSTEGKRLKLLGNEGCTIFLLDAFNGDVVRLPVGPPCTTSLTGHQTWVGETGEIIMTVQARGEFCHVEGKGSTLILRPGDETYRHVSQGFCNNHIGATYCGRYFHGDGWKTQEIAVGSPVTGRAKLVCRSDSSYSERGFGQMGHPHAYLTSDFRRVVFNSDRTGRPQLYVADLPEGFLDELEE